jgi:hypothetical protein
MMLIAKRVAFAEVPVLDHSGQELAAFDEKPEPTP